MSVISFTSQLRAHCSNTVTREAAAAAVYIVTSYYSHCLLQRFRYNHTSFLPDMTVTLLIWPFDNIDVGNLIVKIKLVRICSLYNIL